jgi:hypothetical protein
MGKEFAKATYDKTEAAYRSFSIKVCNIFM